MKFCSFFLLFSFFISTQSAFCIENPIIAGRNLQIRVYLEGAFKDHTSETADDGRPLMRDNLRVNPFNGKNYIPVRDPYRSSVNMIDLSVSNKHIGAGALPEYGIIGDSTGVFSVSGQNAIVDWVFVEIRSSSDNKQVIATRSGLLQRDGDVVELDGVSDLNFPDLTANAFYVVVRHRNHLGVMSQMVNGNNLIDFSDPNVGVFDFGTSLFPMFDYTGMARNKNYGNVATLWAGDVNADLVIKVDPPNDDQNVMFIETEMYAPVGLKSAGAVGYHQGDFDMNGKVKYDNPFDDKNYLYGQVLLYKFNSGELSNFSYFVEQVPKRTN